MDTLGSKLVRSVGFVRVAVVADLAVGERRKVDRTKVVTPDARLQPSGATMLNMGFDMVES